jgi:hypothetical protein
VTVAGETPRRRLQSPGNGDVTHTPEFSSPGTPDPVDPDIAAAFFAAAVGRPTFDDGSRRPGGRHRL